MTPLGEILLSRIDVTGPIPLSEYMAECLLHPEHGYYTRGDAFGAAGDFITAPEISQMFGELLGLALAQSWIDQERPSGAVLAEVGPGRGTLMADALRAMATVAGLPEAFDLHLVEASPRLRQRQRAALSGHSARWCDRLAELPEAPLFLVANEFLDALPIRQFLRHADGWRERLVHRDGNRLVPVFSATAAVPALDHRLGDTEEGEIVELCPSLPTQIAVMASRIARHGGTAILVDYGDWRSRGDTFQAVLGHAPTDPFAAPGEADLTAHVDFEAVARAAQSAGAAVTAMVPQGLLLERLGITQRAQTLARSLRDEAAIDAHVSAHRRLTHPQEMGSLFKAIAIYPKGSNPPPGFET
ncbi:class I SAM-dependent methyltransferase [Tropicimonas sp. IMCC6043]|uniref:class I SAM-dependent methyltransferase n=1 Tax=Tropicimonas sp. IMCC6043 TaxID=2510645 RepID=UPI00101B6087|nr:SAM-dependent methyltransferase [Tropicimonas sp. IMCC6043]RYH08792.1 class I SAM-dependent methyltransferase [Tropicimonas sp. IMCC6043]